VHLGIYRFDGDPDELLAAYERLSAAVPAATSDVHVCARRDDGITIYDTCPSREVFERFSTSDAFLGALAAAGLPQPRVEGHAVHTARVRGEEL
jgi:hypothetical protein